MTVSGDLMDCKEAVPPGHLASLVTHLEMTRPPAGTTKHHPSPLFINRAENISTGDYRALFRKIGERWLWFSRLCLSDHDLKAALSDHTLHLYRITDLHGDDIGMLEMVFGTAGNCEILYLGLVPQLHGQGYGNWLMHQALTIGWRAPKGCKPIQRLWLRTCNFDHPKALGFYRHHGFNPCKQEVEIYPDPRLTGVLPKSAARHIPIIRQR